MNFRKIALRVIRIIANKSVFQLLQVPNPAVVKWLTILEWERIQDTGSPRRIEG